MPLSRIEEAIAEIRDGRMVVLVDDEDRENEGDLTLAAEFVTPEAINFMARHGRGLICLSITEEKALALRLPPMVHDNSSAFGTAFTVSIEARRGVSTGISAHDRATTIRTAIAEKASGLIWLRVHPRLDPIRADPRYWPMVERVGLADVPEDA